MLLFIIGVLIVSSIHAQVRTEIIPIGGDVYDNGGGGPLTDDSPYLVTCDIRIPPSRTLSIQPGALLMFDYGFDLTAYGDLQVEGTSDTPTCFVSTAENYGVVVYDGDIQLQDGGSIKLALSDQKYPLDGTFMYPWKINDMEEFFDKLEAIGMDTVIIGYIKKQYGGCGSDDYRWISGLPGELTDVFDAADAYGFNVYIGTINCGSCGWPDEVVDPNAALTIEETRITAAYIHNEYGDRTSFKGWYLTPEPGPCGPEYIPYIAGLVAAIRESSPKPILMAPYFGNVYEKGYSPQFVAQRAATFMDATGVDIFVWQDTVGAGAIDIGWNNHEWTLEDYYEALSNAIGRDALWSDNELFNWCRDPDYPGGMYNPTSVVRLYNQLKMTKYEHVKKRIVFCYDAYMDIYWNHPEGLRLLAAYKAFYGIEGDYITPRDYTWTTLPADNYPDNGNEMFNKMTGDPKWYLDEDWTGILGDAEVIVDLGKTKQVDWVATHVLNNNTRAIGFPDQLKIYSSDDGQNWNYHGTWNREIDKYDSTFVFSNTEPLDMDCRYVKVRLENPVWTFISEIEIISEEQ